MVLVVTALAMQACTAGFQASPVFVMNDEGAANRGPIPERDIGRMVNVPSTTRIGAEIAAGNHPYVGLGAGSLGAVEGALVGGARSLLAALLAARYGTAIAPGRVSPGDGDTANERQAADVYNFFGSDDETASRVNSAGRDAWPGYLMSPRTRVRVTFQSTPDGASIIWGGEPIGRECYT
jgi:hypothetical protein